MADRLWTDAQDLIMPRLRDCPWPMALMTLRVTAREFFTYTLAWAMWTDDMFTIAGLDEYVPYAGRNVDVFRCLDAMVGKDEYKGANERDFGAAKARGDATRLASWFDSAVHVNPMPTVDEIPLRAYVAVRPTHNSTGLPGEQWKYIDAIVDGAVVRLMRTPNKPYSNPTEAIVIEAEYNRAKGRARSEAARGGYAKQRVVGQYF